MAKEKKMPTPTEEVLTAIAALDAKVTAQGAALVAQAATLNTIMAALNAAASKQTALAGKLHDTQALVLQNTRSIANG